MRDYTFTATLQVAITVEAESQDEAERIIGGVVLSDEPCIEVIEMDGDGEIDRVAGFVRSAGDLTFEWSTQ
jgi:hypothetical protein